MRKQRKKGVHKNISNQRETLDYGPKRIPKSELGGLTEKEYRAQYYDNYKLGVIWLLHKFTPERKLYKKHMVRMIGWGIRDLKNALQDLMKEPPFNTSIKTIKTKRTEYGSVLYYMDNPAFKNLEWETLLSTYLNIRYKKPVPCMEGNKCEKKLVRLVAKMYPDMFAYNGNRLFGKKIGIYTPDILGTYYPIIIEHHGTPFHSTPEKVKKDKIRLKYLKDQGYYVLIIWDYEDKNKNKVKIQIKDFVDNAIQDISQLAV